MLLAGGQVLHFGLQRERDVRKSVRHLKVDLGLTVFVQFHIAEFFGRADAVQVDAGQRHANLFQHLHARRLTGDIEAGANHQRRFVAREKLLAVDIQTSSQLVRFLPVDHLLERR